MIISKRFIEWVDEMAGLYQSDYVSFDRFDNGKIGSKKRKRGYVAIDKRTGKTAKSNCNPNECFDATFGRAIAYARLRGIEIPPMEVYLVKDCFGKTVKYKGTLYYVTSVLAYCGVSKEFYCLRFGKGGMRPTVVQLCEDTEVEIVE
jgi:hypothetical protein